MGCLSGVGLVFGNLTHRNHVELSDLATSLGATILRPSDAPRASYLVASNVLRLPDGSDPYLVAFQLNPGLVAVSPDWLSTCQAEQRQVEASPYLLGPFSGIRVSITNFGAKERDGVVSQLKQGCATPSPELYRTSTHLVGSKAGGNKHTHAREWGLFVVHYDWVLDCLKAGHRLDERPYNLDTYVPREPAGGATVSVYGDPARQSSRTLSSGRCGAASDAGAAAVTARQGAASIRGIVAPSSGLPGPGHALPPHPSRATALQPANGAAPLVSTGAGAGPGPEAPLPPATFDPKPATTHITPAPVAAAGATAGAYSALHHSEQYFRVPAVPSDDCYFLHWVRMWVVGCTAAEQSHVLAAVRESGATREPTLTAAVTHIVFGSVLSTADLAEVRQHLAEHREQVKLARLGWLYECVNRRAYLEPEGPYAMTVAALLLAQGGAGTGALLPGQAARGGAYRGRESSPAPFASAAAVATAAAGPAAAPSCGGGRMVAPLDDYVPLEPDGGSRTLDSVSVRGAGEPGVFSGLWFTLVAVAGTEEEAAATRLVRQGGGMIMSASTERSVRDPQRRFAVCPFSMPQAAVDRLSAARGRDRGLSEFERVPAEQRITLAWLRACVARGELLPVKRETPLFRPLPHALPLPGFQGQLVAVSQYHVEQREVLEELIRKLGGTYTEKLNKRCSYLVVQEARGDKFAYAVKWGIPCVRADWVLESAHAGRPLRDQLPAFLPAGITPAEMEEMRAAAASRGPGGESSQMCMGLGPTQRPGASQIPGRGLPGSSSQYDMESSRGAAAAAPGLPPRPTQAPDRRAAPTQAAAPAPLPLAASTLPPRGPTQPQPPPPRQPQPQHAQPADMAAPRVREVPVAPAPAGAARPPSLLKPLLNAILQDDPADADQPGAPPAAAADRHEGQMSAAAGAQASYNPPYSTASVQVPQPGCSAADPAAMGPGTAGPHDSAGTFASVAGACEEEEEADGPRAGPAAPGGPGWAAPMAGAGAAGAAGAPAAAPEHAGATALLMQFLDNHQLVPDMVASQLDMPFPLLMSGPLGGEGAHTGGPTLSEASRQLPASSLSMKPPEGDVAGGAGAGRRSRKRNAAASVGESVGAVSGKMTSLPGRRGRSVDEEDGFGVAMSQQVGYEAVAAAPPPRTTRSSSRARR